jgi:hypothetical protein
MELYLSSPPYIACTGSVFTLIASLLKIYTAYRNMCSFTVIDSSDLYLIIYFVSFLILWPIFMQNREKRQLLVVSSCLSVRPSARTDHLHEDPSYYYPPIYAWVSPVVSFPQVFPPKPCTHVFPPRSELHVPPTSFSILSLAQ